MSGEQTRQNWGRRKGDRWMSPPSEGRTYLQDDFTQQDTWRVFRVLAEFVNAYIADGRWIRVTGQEGAQYVQLTRNPGALRYDIIVDEATMSRDSRERSFLALMQIIPMAMQSGVPIPPEVIDYAPVPETLRLKWKEMLHQGTRRGLLEWAGRKREDCW